MTDALPIAPSFPGHDLPRGTGLAAQLAGELARGIQAGALRPGGRLPTEKQLAERYRVSRAVVREAIARLKTDGLVESRQGAGAFVVARPGLASFRINAAGAAPAAPLEQADLAHVFELRGVIEAGMAELAALRRTPADLAALHAAFAAMAQAQAAGGDAGAAADDAFHAAIAAAAHNPHLAQLAAYLAQHFSATRALTWQAGARAAGLASAAQAEHRRLLDAIAAGDAPAAGYAARSHIRQAAARAAAISGD